MSKNNMKESVEDSWLIQQVETLVPVLAYCQKVGEVLEDNDDTATLEWILQAQAYDENYIDENGELVGEEVVIDVVQEDNSESETTETSSEINMEKLVDLDYLLNNYYVVDKTVSVDDSVMNADEWITQDLSLAENVNGPQILIYHTHSQEDFVDSTPGDLSTTIVGVGDYLTEVLEETYGVEVLHHREVYDLIDGELDRSMAYELAAVGVQEVLDANPSIELVIDLHRDGVDQHTHLVTMINDKPTAQIMYFNGLSSTISNGAISYLENPYIQDNLALSFQMQLASEELYPGFSRRIYLKSYRYNLHLMPKTMLIEAGAQTNTLEEMYNAMEVLAEILSVVVGL
ncbi:MAG: stage II sporulation protein P [Eubacteriales bacterium]